MNSRNSINKIMGNYLYIYIPVHMAVSVFAAHYFPVNTTQGKTRGQQCPWNTYKIQVQHHMFPYFFVQAMPSIETCLALNSTYRTNHRSRAMKWCWSAHQAAACRNMGAWILSNPCRVLGLHITVFFPPAYANLRSVSAAHMHTCAPVRQENNWDCHVANTQWNPTT